MGDPKELAGIARRNFIKATAATAVGVAASIAGGAKPAEASIIAPKLPEATRREVKWELKQVVTDRALAEKGIAPEYIEAVWKTYGRAETESKATWPRLEKLVKQDGTTVGYKISFKPESLIDSTTLYLLARGLGTTMAAFPFGPREIENAFQAGVRNMVRPDQVSPECQFYFLDQAEIDGWDEPQRSELIEAANLIPGEGHPLAQAEGVVASFSSKGTFQKGLGGNLYFDAGEPIRTYEAEFIKMHGGSSEPEKPSPQSPPVPNRATI